MADIISSKALASQRILRVDDNLNTGVNNLAFGLPTLLLKLWRDIAHKDMM